MSDWSSFPGGIRTKIKVIFLGDQSVGKSSIIDKYIKEEFVQGSNPTVGIDFHIKNVMWEGKNFRLQLWDTAGQERFRSLIPSYLKDAGCGIFVYDISQAKSLKNLQLWQKMFDQYAQLDAVKIVVGNKTDLASRREVKQESALEHAKKNKSKYIEVSAKSGSKVNDLFNLVIESVEERNRVTLPMINQNGEVSGSVKPTDRQNHVKINGKQSKQKNQYKKRKKDKCC